MMKNMGSKMSDKKVRFMTKKIVLSLAGLVLALQLTACADARGPAARNVSIPTPQSASERKEALNENGDPVTYLPLGEDVLMPQAEEGAPLPSTVVGPFELRGETLAGALQLILDGTNIPVAFEGNDSLTQTITVTNLKGPLDVVVSEVCSLANMYCSYQNGMLIVKDRQIFTVSVPPIVSADNMEALLTNMGAALGSITGEEPITDASTRTIVYRASQRTSEIAKRYFQRLRSNTALVIFETYVWEVVLDAGNTTGIRWDAFENIGRFNFGVNLAGAADTNVGSPISIGLPTTGSVNFTTGDVLQFISSYGAVKTVSQPQITVLSGSTARLRVADTENYVSSISRTTTDGGNTTVSTTTDSVDSGFTLEIGSNWDNSTVYGDINILLQENQGIDVFDENPDAVVQLPRTTERELQTQIRIRPGDLLLIAGLVRESDELDREGLGLAEPIIPTTRTVKTGNTELVFLLRPRVIVFTPQSDKTPRKESVTAPVKTELSAQQAVSSPAEPVVDKVVDSAPVADVSKEVLAAPITNPSPVVTAAPTSKPVVSNSSMGDTKVVMQEDSSPATPAHKAAASKVESEVLPAEVPPVPVKVMTGTPAVPASKVASADDGSVQIEKLDSVVPENVKSQADPSVIINRDVLNR